MIDSNISPHDFNIYMGEEGIMNFYTYQFSINHQPGNYGAVNFGLNRSIRNAIKNNDLERLYRLRNEHDTRYANRRKKSALLPGRLKDLGVDWGTPEMGEVIDANRLAIDRYKKQHDIDSKRMSDAFHTIGKSLGYLK